MVLSQSVFGKLPSTDLSLLGDSVIQWKEDKIWNCNVCVWHTSYVIWHKSLHLLSIGLFICKILLKCVDLSFRLIKMIFVKQCIVNCKALHKSLLLKAPSWFVIWSCLIKNCFFTGKYITLCCNFKLNKLAVFASSDRLPTHHITAGESLLSDSKPFYSHFAHKPTKQNTLFLLLINATCSTMSN